MMRATCLVLAVLMGCTADLIAQTKVDIGHVVELHVTDKLNVVLVPSDENSVLVDGDLKDKVEVTQQDGKLRIKMASGYPLKGANTFVRVHSPSIYSFTVQKGAVVQTEEGSIEQDSILVWANEGGKLDLAVNVKRVEVNSTTGSSVTLRGDTESQNIILTFGGNYYAEKLNSKKAFARTNGGGVCDVRASVSADVQTRAGGYINVYGNPTERKQKRLAGGKITFMTK
ncbi:head GIN domain-containing protein [Sphingobacterium paludis]|uniref:Putative autotransporter adhesin-like protein n=1 Tax=Sphingobacterium paludis TaxID=1476465 RepID=A0A4R7CZ35_9SPHI|nr:head GIN domain-containing protein [Sphingobacterium paludis]TDS13021.1 putative autotransporter adhesin-like protein [Sphingobacterium paludis]